jgi:hypothetical protein
MSALGLSFHVLGLLMGRLMKPGRGMLQRHWPAWDGRDIVQRHDYIAPQEEKSTT